MAPPAAETMACVCAGTAARDAQWLENDRPVLRKRSTVGLLKHLFFLGYFYEYPLVI